jgi:histidyl-tRNA synthetase
MAPVIMDYLGKESKNYFNKVCSILGDCGINYDVNNFLVRGLDYYHHTVFELLSTGGSFRDALGGGGRYDKLLASFGGQDVSGIGFALGIDRLMALMEPSSILPKRLKIAVIPVYDSENDIAFSVFMDLQKHEIASEFLHVGNLRKKLKIADRLKCDIALILGETEVADQSVMVKFMNTCDPEDKPKQIKLNNIINYLRCL